MHVPVELRNDEVREVGFPGRSRSSALLRTFRSGDALVSIRDVRPGTPTMKWRTNAGSRAVAKIRANQFVTRWAPGIPVNPHARWGLGPLSHAHREITVADEFAGWNAERPGTDKLP